MSESTCCSNVSSAQPNQGHETVLIEQTTKTCPMCEHYAEAQKAKPIAVLCCEGACLRGEVARQAANLLCHYLMPDKTVRICLGGAFTKDTGQRQLVRKAPRVIALEGCFLECASRMMRGVISGFSPDVIVADTLYDFDRSLFGVDEMPAEDIRAHAATVAQRVRGML